MGIKWDYFVSQYDPGRYVTSSDARDNRHIQFVREFASVVSVLQVRVAVFCFAFCGSRFLTHAQDKTNSVIDLYKEILRAVEDLSTCPYTSEAFSELLGKIQTAVRSPSISIRSSDGV